MKILDAPHYRQAGGSDCQAACAAMMMDYWTRRGDGGSEERLKALFEEFAFSFVPTEGDCPAITGLVALTIAGKGFTVDFYSKNPDGGGTQGLAFLRKGDWNWPDSEIERYASHAQQILVNPPNNDVTTHNRCMTSQEIEQAINAGQPVVVVVDRGVLQRIGKGPNHVYLITGIDADRIYVNDPAKESGLDEYDRESFLNAHRQDSTDHDAYVIRRRSCWRTCTAWLRRRLRTK